ncbi:methyl-accepting chemotaxis protein [Vibrio rotiferianus]|uniref:methyl-accepting chemotaxis protein n=1 Tax=Vibrio rotiferianus TaxID=190895 RepID=UPI00406A36A6
MTSLLRRFPLYVVVCIVAGIPLVIAIILSTQNVLVLERQAKIAIRDTQLVDLATNYDNLAHNLAVERGLTAGVLGSKGNPEIVNKLRQQRLKVDLAVSALSQSNTDMLDSKLTTSLAQDIHLQLAQLSKVRSGVDQLAPHISPFHYYSNLNQLIIDNIKIVIAETQSNELTLIGDSLVAIVTMKERAGQVRGALNGVFASKTATPVLFSSVKSYIQSGDYALRAAHIAMLPSYQERLMQVQREPAWKNVEEIQLRFLAQENNLGSIEGPSATQWFPVATQRIGLLNQLRNEMQSDMLAHAEALLKSSIWNRNILIGVTALTSVLLLGLVLTLVRSLRYRVGSMKQKLGNMTEQHDLTVELTHDGRDEISAIASSINRLTKNIKDLLFNVTDTNAHNTERLNSIVDSTQELDNSSRSTIAKCDNIATAMTELAQSSIEIAQSAERALDDTSEMNTKVQECQQQSELSFTSVKSLLEQIQATEQCMSELESDTQSIGQIVEAINGISEQTNLLALNAAIEAARAGEHGRGFAVVSSEVRDLAQRSQEATENISKLLDKITEKTRFSVENMAKSKHASDITFEAVKRVDNSVSLLETSIENVNNHINTIAHSTVEQSKACEAVDKDVDILAEIAKTTGQQADSLSEVVLGYQKDNQDLNNQLSKFKLS